MRGVKPPQIILLEDVLMSKVTLIGKIHYYDNDFKPLQELILNNGGTFEKQACDSLEDIRDRVDLPSSAVLYDEWVGGAGCSKYACKHLDHPSPIHNLRIYYLRKQVGRFNAIVEYFHCDNGAWTTPSSKWVETIRCADADLICYLKDHHEQRLIHHRMDVEDHLQKIRNQSNRK
jgi:hypothetical protein